MRIDSFLCQKGLCKSRTKAAEMIKSGDVLLSGKAFKKPSEEIDENTDLKLIFIKSGPKRVSRAYEKLNAAFECFDLDARGLTFLDLGASTGGFTQCLLDHGAKKVFAVDVGHGQLDESLKNDSRVVCAEGVNARYMTPEMFCGEIEGAVSDLSFISQALVYPALSKILPSGAKFVSLVKPQFEVGRENVGRGVVNLTEKLLNDVFDRLIAAGAENDLIFEKYIESPIKGGDGNREFVALFHKR